MLKNILAIVGYRFNFIYCNLSQLDYLLLSMNDGSSMKDHFTTILTSNINNKF